MESLKKNKNELNKQSAIMNQITEIENMLIKKILKNRSKYVDIIKVNKEAINFYKKIVSIQNQMNLHQQ